MAVHNAAAQGAVDAYAGVVKKQKEYAMQYEQNVRQVLVPKDQKAEQTALTSYQNLKYATGVFDAASSDKLTLEQQREKIIQERDKRIADAREQAIKEGKTEDEISKITDKIALEYTDRITNLDYNIARAGRTTLLKQNTLAQARSIYNNDHFSQIGTSNDVYSGFMQASTLWHDVGRMQQFQGFLQAQADAGDKRLNLNG